MDSFRTTLTQAAAALELTLDDVALDRFAAFRDLLQSWGRAMNLVGDEDEQAILHKHLIDGLVHARAVADGGPRRLVDIGAGAGLPGLVLAIVRPELGVTLVESLQKRCSFMAEVAASLALENVTVEPRRAEEVGRDEAYRERGDLATARRLAELNILLEYALPLLAVGGVALFAKGERLEEELAAARGVPALLGGGEPTVFELAVPFGEAPALRRFVRVEKVAPTPERYPRAPGRAEKRPLRGES